MRLLCSLFLSLLVCTIYAQEEDASISGREKWVYITSILFPWLEDARSSLYCKEVIFFFARGSHKFEIKIKKEWDIIFARGSHKCPQDPSFSCNDDQTCCKLPKGEVPVFIHLCSLNSEVFFTKLFFVLLLSTRIIKTFIIINIPLPAGGRLLPLQGRHLLQRSNSLLSTR